jgi:NAD dependent epimerase/dehydratase family enzyme
VTNAELTRTLARVLRRPARLRVPAPMLRLALREQAGLLLASQRVVPGEPLRLGHRFLAGTFGEAVSRLLEPPAQRNNPDSR